MNDAKIDSVSGQIRMSEGRHEPHSLDVPALLDRAGRWVMRYGLVTVIAWIGAMKFTAYEAAGIAGLVAHSPLMGWVYGVMGEQSFSFVLGVIELSIAAAIAVKPWWPRAAAAGAFAAVGMFLTTLSFMASTPGVFEASAGGFPALSVVPGQFLLKDLALLGTSIFLVGEALRDRGSYGATGCGTGESVCTNSYAV